MPRTTSPAYRQIPAVDRILDSPGAAALISRTSRPFVVFLVRRVLEDLRRELAGNDEKEWSAPDLDARILEALQQEFRSWTCPGLKKVINATGVILHTNLGRAPVGDAARRHLAEVASNYSNLEFDLARAQTRKARRHCRPPPGTDPELPASSGGQQQRRRGIPHSQLAGRGG